MENKLIESIGVIGGGVVGSATARCYLEHVNEVRVYDVNPLRSTHSLSEVIECGKEGIIFVCLPTPQKQDSLECDLSYIEKFFSDYSGSSANFVLRSTVPIGTTRLLAKRYNLPNLCHSPEFLTARCAITDAMIPARNIIGYPNDITYYLHESVFKKLCLLYHLRFPGTKLFVMPFDASEAVKLIQNSLFAVTVSFWNEMRTLTDKLGLSYDAILEAILADGRVSSSHTKVPGPDGWYGFGGSCLPKDLANLVDTLNKNNLLASITEAALHRNKHDRGRKVD